MNWIETEAFLRARRALTREVYTDETITAWSQALAPWQYEDCHKALIEASRGTDRVFVAQIVKHLAPPPPTGPTRDAHSIACMCGGRGWLEVEQHDDNGTWMAWARCPNGPPTGFIEL